MDTGVPDGLLHVVTSDPTPPFEQLRRQLVELITSGRLAPGRRLPPVRQLAADLGLAAGTVARTYRELEAEGLVTTRRGGGTRVSDGVPRRRTSLPASGLQEHVTALVRRARRLGASDEQVRAAVETALATAADTRTAPIDPTVTASTPIDPTVTASPPGSAPGPTAGRKGAARGGSRPAPSAPVEPRARRW
jgi:GntR family transcriptional regulator